MIENPRETDKRRVVGNPGTFDEVTEFYVYVKLLEIFNSEARMISRSCWTNFNCKALFTAPRESKSKISLAP